MMGKWGGGGGRGEGKRERGEEGGRGRKFGGEMLLRK